MQGPTQKVFQNFPLDNEKIIAEVIKYNSEVLKLDIDPNPIVDPIDLPEGSSKFKYPQHRIHKGNLYKQGKIVKLIALYNINSPDEFQGGNIEFENWKRFRVDNYGNPQGDIDSHVPDWINEKGTLIIYPSLIECEADIVVSGTVKRMQYKFMGDNYK